MKKKRTKVPAATRKAPVGKAMPARDKPDSPHSDDSRLGAPLPAFELPAAPTGYEVVT